LRVDLPRSEDAVEIYRLVGGDDREVVCATLVWDGPEDIENIEWWIDRCSKATFADWGYHWVVRDRVGDLTGTAGTPLGAVGTRPRSEGVADVGYWIGRPYWGMGIMSEVLPSVLGLGFARLGFARMEADVFAHNERGRRLVERAGMTEEGVTEKGHLKQGSWVDVLHYAISAARWGEIQSGESAGSGGR
jgi:[ribosomal protein S5]-alanine N-acetyltransferase